jgi:hypothetical protein
MSDEPRSPPAPVQTKTAPTTIGARIDRALESLREKNARLVAENQRLKELLSMARSAGTRISRIPKVAKKEKVAEDPEHAEA